MATAFGNVSTCQWFGFRSNLKKYFTKLQIKNCLLDTKKLYSEPRLVSTLAYKYLIMQKYCLPVQNKLSICTCYIGCFVIGNTSDLNLKPPIGGLLHNDSNHLGTKMELLILALMAGLLKTL
jgi:hypothetical protein